MQEQKQNKKETKKAREERIRKENKIISDTINKIFRELKEKENKNS